MKKVILVCLVLIIVLVPILNAAANWETDWENGAVLINVGAVVNTPDGKPLNVRAKPGTIYDAKDRLENGQQIFVYSQYGDWAYIGYDSEDGYVQVKYITLADIDPVYTEPPSLKDWAGLWNATLNDYNTTLLIDAGAGSQWSDVTATISFGSGFSCSSEIEWVDPWHLKFKSDTLSAVLNMNPTADAVELTYVLCTDDDLNYILDDVFHYDIIYARSGSTPADRRVSGTRTIVFEDEETPRKKSFTVSFSTDMFLQDTTKFHPDIAGLAVLLSANAYNVDEENYPGVPIVDTYHELDIDDDHIMLFNYQGHPLNVRNDPLAADMDEFSIASRDMGDYELLFITIRGSGQLKPFQTISPDWLLDVSARSRESMNAWVHEGFYSFMIKVYDGISRYLWDHPEISRAMEEDRLKVLITGHSRGGAAANLLGAFLLDTMFKTDNPIYTAGMDDTFVYTFACPRVMHEKDGNPPNKTTCRNIFNVVINFDPVPKLPKDFRFGWKRYGTTYTYRTTYNDKFDNSFANHMPINYIRAVLEHEYIKKQADTIKNVIVSADP